MSQTLTELDQTIANAFASEGAQEDANKVYLALIRTPVYLPVKKQTTPVSDEEEPFQPLFAEIEGRYFMMIFDTLERLTTWAESELDQIDYVCIPGRDVVAGVNESVYLCLNAGCEYYKEFSPEEVKRIKMIIARIDQLRSEKPT